MRRHCATVSFWCLVLIPAGIFCLCINNHFKVKRAPLNVLCMHLEVCLPLLSSPPQHTTCKHTKGENARESTVRVFSLICFRARAPHLWWMISTRGIHQGCRAGYLSPLKWMEKTICLMLWNYRLATFKFTLLMEHIQKYYMLPVFKLVDKPNLW